jgi:glycosyltransferase involved in cell wall biosynthesis
MTKFQDNESARRRRALFIAYTFPPVGGAGVQRTTKFVKYLPQCGWDASVLTVSNPSVPLRDESLVRDVPPTTKIVRARTFEPSYARKMTLAEGKLRSGIIGPLKHALSKAMMGLLQPDPQILWNAPAFLAGVRALRRTPHDVIVASAPPFSSLLLGAALSTAARIPLVLDYRDEWDVSNKYWENRHVSGSSVAIQRAMENYALRHGSAVIATSPRSAGALSTLSRRARSGASVTHIFNGFDPDDFRSSDQSAIPPDGTWRLVYTGTLYHLMSPEPLVRAIEALASIRPDLAARIELVFAGRHTPEQRQRLARLALICRLNTREYVSHAEAIGLMRSADAVCVLLSDLPGADRVIPAKLFEYIASEKPILAIAPRGDVWDLLRPHPAAFAFQPGDVSQIKDWLVRAIEGDVRAPEPGTIRTEPFNRQLQAKDLASLLDDLVSVSGVRQRVSQEAACSA